MMGKVVAKITSAHFAAHVEHYPVRRLQFKDMSDDTVAERFHYGQKCYDGKSCGENHVYSIAMGDWNTRFHRKPITGDAAHARFYGDSREAHSMDWSKAVKAG